MRSGSRVQPMISGVVLAAGLSTRMGRAKQLLPFGEHTVIEQVVAVLQESGVDELVVVTGHERRAVEAALSNRPAHCVFNPGYAEGDMLSSVQVGLCALSPEAQAALIALGDQPQIEPHVVRQLIAAYRETGAPIVVPTHGGRRGHPVVIDRSLWPEVLALSWNDNLRTVVGAHSEEILHVPVETPAVLRDLDTPEDYEQTAQWGSKKFP